jgi:phenylalanyl-tRNA synthetase beta chain
MRLRRLLASRGFHETRSLTLISEKALQSFPPIPYDMLALGTPVPDSLAERVLRVRNPLNEEQVVLRPSLIPGLLEAFARNVRNGVRDLHLFELGRVFLGERPVAREEMFEEGDHENLIEEEVREERTYLAMLLSGAVHPASWRDAKPRQADFFDLKGALSAFNLGELSFEPVSHPALALAVEIRCAGTAIGVAGQLQPARARELDAAAPVLVAELDIELFDAAQTRVRFTELPKFPAVTRDIAMLAPLAVSNARVEAVLRSANEPLLVDLELFDVFTDLTGEKIPTDKKSMAFALTYRSGERTLTADEATAIHNRLKEKLRAELAVTFRE